MQLKFSDNYNLFVIYLILNLSGYNDENNKKGMHPLRIKVRKYFEKYKKDYKELFDLMMKFSKQFHYSRVAELFILIRENYKVRKELKSGKKTMSKVIPLIENFEKGVKLKQYYREHYLPQLKKIINKKSNKQKLLKYKKDILNFVKSRERKEILVIFNPLESYWRGHSHFANNRKALLNIGPDNKNDNINWHNIVHETLHFLLRRDFIETAKKFSSKLRKIIREKTIDPDYKNNPPMYQIEETFIRGFTPLILDENYPDYWDYLKDRFPLSELIYKQLKENLVKGRVKFNQKILRDILKKVEEQYA